MTIKTSRMNRFGLSHWAYGLFLGGSGLAAFGQYVLGEPSGARVIFFGVLLAIAGTVVAIVEWPWII
jgi:hypothetical protein